MRFASIDRSDKSFVDLFDSNPSNSGVPPAGRILLLLFPRENQSRRCWISSHEVKASPSSRRFARKFKSRLNLDHIYFAFRWFKSGYRFENSARAQKCIRKIVENFKAEKTEKSLEISVFLCLHLFQALNL